MKLFSSRKQRLAIALGVVVLLALWLPWQEPSPVQYSEAQHLFANDALIPTDRMVARWINDMDQDQFPDLVLAFQADNPLWGLQDKLSWLPFDFELEEMPLQVFELSGSDGKMISTRSIDPFVSGSFMQVLDIFLNPEHPEEPSFLLGLDKTAVGFIQGSEFRLFPGILDNAGGLSWAVGPNPAMVYQSETELVVHRLGEDTPSTTFPSLGTGSDLFVSSNIFGLNTTGQEAMVAIVRLVKKSNISPDEFQLFLQYGKFPSGEVSPEIELELLEEKTDFFKWPIGRYDQNGDHVADWLLLNHGYSSQALRWYDGRTGRILRAESEIWNRRISLTPKYTFEMSIPIVTTSLGLVHFVESETRPGKLTIGLKDWPTGEVIWEIPTSFTAHSERLRLKVTEFDDLDGDGVIDLGLTATSEIGTSSSSLQFLGILVSGKTGLAIQKP
jgi:hypothetical protein